jgi:hypothetical protein
MIRKKPPQPPESRRSVRRQETVNVFSYYANRAPDASLERPDIPKQKKKPGQRLNWLKRSPAWATCIILLGFVFYTSTLSTSPKIQVMNKTDRTLIRGVGDYQADVGAVLGRSVWNRSKLLINTNKVADELKQEYPELGDVSVVLPLAGRRPIVEVSPAEPALILGTGSGAYVVDREGRAIVDVNKVESSVRDPLPVVQDESGLPLERGKNALPKDAVTFIATVSGQLAAANVKVQSFILPAGANELHVKIEGRPHKIKFDIKGEGRQAAGAFLAVKQRLETEHKTPAEYIDVRVPEKAFYK